MCSFITKCTHCSLLVGIFLLLSFGPFSSLCVIGVDPSHVIKKPKRWVCHFRSVPTRGFPVAHLCGVNFSFIEAKLWFKSTLIYLCIPPISRLGLIVYWCSRPTCRVMLYMKNVCFKNTCRPAHINDCHWETTSKFRADTDSSR